MFVRQKDDLYIGIHNGEASDYASQGQHKSLLIALKYAEFQYLYAQKQEKPIYYMMIFLVNLMQQEREMYCKQF